jgi:protoheme IX farnesyltransferase
VAAVSTLADRAPSSAGESAVPTTGETALRPTVIRDVVPARPRPKAVFRAYLALTKPRIVELLLVTTVPAMLLARHRVPSLWLMLVTLVGGALAAGAANALNCYIDRDIDPLMRRTSKRPLPAHTIAPRSALIFGLTLAVVSVAVMAAFTNLLAAGLTAVAIAYYDLVYTMWLKRTTPANTFWGGVCGAMPVLIGWAAVTGSVGWPAWAMFAVVFLWQPPHFWALAITCKDDYARAGIPMLPVVATLRRVGFEMVIYTWLTLVASLALWALGMSLVYGVTAVVVGALFVLEAHRVYGRARRDKPLKPMRMFHWSTTYLTILSIAISVDALIH